MRILRRHKKAAVKPARGHRPASADPCRTLSTFGGSLLALESRIMFDGAAVATAGTVTTEQIAQSQAEASFGGDDATTADSAPAAPTGEAPAAADQALFDALAAYDTSAARQEIVFLSPSVRDYQKLLDGISPNVEVIILDPTRDGVEQMAEALAGRTGIDAVHLIGDGTEAEMHLGASFLTQDSIGTTYAEQFQQIGQSLSADADLLIYGCNFGRGEAGQAAIQTLATLTGVDVAASTDRTGHSTEFGDWILETSTGAMEASIVIGDVTQATWEGVLATYTVINTNDSGAGSLRQAIIDANANAGSDTIDFTVGGVGPHIINLLSALPTITDTVIIDATTQSGYAVGSPVIILDGTGAGAEANGFVLQANNSTIAGFRIQDFVSGTTSISGTGIVIDGTTGGGDNNTISQNYLTNNSESVSGAVGAISITGAADNNLITNNQLINNNSDGIRFANALSTGAQITNNVITGSGDDGVKLVGANITFTGNTLSNSQRLSAGAAGVELDTVTGTSVVSNNTITNDSTHGSEGGVWIANASTGVTVGNNTITGWSGSGIAIAGTSTGICLTQNSISNNGLLGIDLVANGVTANDVGDGDAGANNLQNYPVLTSAQVVSSTQVTIVGTFNSTANSYFRIEFFSSTAQDGTGHGEGQTYLGFVNVTTDGSGNATFNTTLAATVSAGSFVSATATASNATFTTFTDTSEFAQNAVAANSAPVLDASKSPALTAINEDAGAPVGVVGTLVSSLVDFAVPAGQVDNVTDVDSGALLGIAITAADTTNGTWFYSTNNGADWNALGAVANNNACLMTVDATTRLYFQPNTDYNGTLANAITFRAWDQTSGSNGMLTDTSTNGGTTAFSTATDTASLVVNAVNDAPVAVNDAYSVNEDTTLVVGPPTTNLANYWNFNDGGTSQIVVDSGSLANNGTLGSTAGVDANDPAWTAGYVGANALSFDGTTDYVSTNSTIAKTASNFTLSAWFQTDTTTGAHHILWEGYTGGNGYGNGGSTSPATSEMSLSIGSYNASYDNKIVFFLGYDVPPTTANSIFIASASNYTDTAGWHHVAVTVSDLGGGVMSASLHVDGQLEGTDTGSENDRSAWNSLLIGGTSSGTRLFDGKMDEVRIYDTALTGAQVQSIEQAGILQNDSDIDSSLIKVNTSVVTGPTNGTLAMNADGSFTYIPNANFAGIDSFTYRANDGTFNSNVATVTITVNPINDAPVLADTVVTFATENEDAGVPSGAVGTLVSTLVAGVSDVDTSAVKGIAVTAADSTNGTWFYSTNNGAAWIAMGAPTGAASRLLAADANTRLYFQPNADYNGTLASGITFRAWDQTSGSNGTLADTAINGGSTAFSTLTDTASLVVTAVNDAPAITALADQTIAEDETTGALPFTVSDVETAAGALTVTAVSSNTTLIPNGNLTLVDLGGGSWTIAATPALNQFGGPVTITVTVSDGTATTNETFDVTVTAVNDAPVVAGAGGTLAYTENAPATVIDNTLTITDVDDTNIESATVTISAGNVPAEDVLSFTAAFGITGTYTPATGILALSGTATLAQYESVLESVAYQNTSDNPNTGNRTITWVVFDGNDNSAGTTSTLTVAAVNDAPVVAANTGSTVARGGTDPIIISELQITDVDNTPAQLTYTVTVVPANGQLELTTGPGTAITTFTQAQIDAGQVVYVHNGSFTVSDSFTFTASDGAGGSIAATIFGITVTPVNSVPTLATNVGSTVIQGSTDLITSGELQVTDVDNTPAQLTYTVTVGPVNGQLELTTAPGVAVTSFTQADINAGRLVFVHSGADSTSDSFTFTVSDGAGGTIGATTFNLTVTPFFLPPPPPPPPRPRPRTQFPFPSLCRALLGRSPVVLCRLCCHYHRYWLRWWAQSTIQCGEWQCRVERLPEGGAAGYRTRRADGP